MEQIDELLLVHNKNDPKEGIGVVSQADEKGNYRTVPPEEKNENSFLKFDKNSSILENFIKNFWSQLKEPTHFRLIRMTFHDYKQNRQALKDLASGKETDAVKEFLKRYEIVPKNNQQSNVQTKEEEKAMATMIKQTKEEISWAEIARAREMGVLDKLLAERDVIRFNLRSGAEAAIMVEKVEPGRAWMGFVDGVAERPMYNLSLIHI